MYLIRADGNAAIGMGHVMRCLSIADAMSKQGMMPLFLTACRECVPMIEQRGYETLLLGTDYRDMESELPVIGNYLAGKDGRHVILVDSYQVTAAYYLGLRKLARVACLEDMGQSYPVDLLINYNIYAPELFYDNSIVGAKLLGLSYQPLRQEFQTDTEYMVKNNITDVMITTGGADPLGMMPAMITALVEKKLEMVYHVVIGPFFQNGEQLHQLYDSIPNVILHEHVTCLKEIMRSSDVVISATGSTIYEVSALGVPLIAFYYAENQRQGAEKISQITHVTNCGNYANEPQQTVRNIVTALEHCVEDVSYRRLLSREERTLVDGHGAARIAKALAD